MMICIKIILYLSTNYKQELQIILKHIMETNSSLTKVKDLSKNNSKTFKVLPVLAKNKLRKLLKKRRVFKANEQLKTSLHSGVRQQKNNLFLSNLAKQEFVCIICLNVIVFPYKLECAHIYCFMCIDQMSKPDYVGGDKCPCCRAKIGQYYPTYQKNWSTLLSFVIEKFSQSQKEQYHKRYLNAQNQLNERVRLFKFLRVGQKVDCRIGNTWHIGRIIQINQIKSKFSIKVISEIKNNLYEFSTTSPHLALYRTFTKHLKCLPQSPFGSEEQIDSQQYLDFYEQVLLRNTTTSILMEGGSVRDM